MKKSLSMVSILLILLAPGICQEAARSPALASLVAAERAFARTSVEKGIRASFIEFIADDGIGFNPHPIKLRELYLKRPAPATLPPVELNWQPVYADVSRAGDLGYTTGPYTFIDKSPEKKPTRYGFYFSVWKKQADGSWKVAVDCGISTPDHSGQKYELRSPPQIKSNKAVPKIDSKSAHASLVDQDAQLLAASQSMGLVKGFLKYLGDEARLDRDGALPIVGRDAIRSFLSTQAAELSSKPIGSDISQTDDLGYTYGSYELKRPKTSEVEKGYYVRVWKRDKKGDWKLVLDTHSPIPPETK